jgi:hypothetical protein
MAIARKREFRNGPNLAGIIPYGPAIGKFSEKFEFLKSKMAARRHFEKH